MLFGLFLIFILFSSPVKADKIILKVFHAGSLSAPFEAIEKAFEARYPGIDVRRESSGSVRAIRKVTEVHKPCDVIASADYSLIPKMMFPQYADHVYLFARNELVLAFTPRSKFSREINQKNWFQILAHPEIKWGFSNPNLDPCGYRTVIMLALAEKLYQKPLLNLLLTPHLSLQIKRKGDLTKINLPEAVIPKGKKVFIRPKAVELLGLLESGALDYAIEYLSVAKQHNLRYLRLPDEINLGKKAYEDFYHKV